jgi:hypothetical protein
VREELRRNFLGFLLLATGVGLVMLGTHTLVPKLSDAGFGIIGMAGLALQVKPVEPKEPAKTETKP